MTPGNKNSYNSLKKITVNDKEYRRQRQMCIRDRTFIGKFLRKFATNDKFINYFNYAMSLLLLLSIVTCLLYTSPSPRD